ncbi:MAG: 4Fe-4S binding protein [Chloroflexota bacterium]
MIAVDLDRCNGCGICTDICPTGAIQMIDGYASFTESLCNECHACAELCPAQALLVVVQLETGDSSVDHQTGTSVALPEPLPEPQIVSEVKPVTSSLTNRAFLTRVGSLALAEAANWALHAWEQKHHQKQTGGRSNQFQRGRRYRHKHSKYYRNRQKHNKSRKGDI